MNLKDEFTTHILDVAKTFTLMDVMGWAAGAAMVLAPIAIVVKGFMTPLEPIHLTLPLPVSTPTASTYREVNDRELDCLANNIYYESRNQSPIGQLAVGMVTLTRVESERWSNTVCGVVYDYKQFTWTWDGKQPQNANRNYIDQLRYLEALHLSSRILSGEFDNIRAMFTADHYHARSVRPKWAKHMERLVSIDDHIFYVDQ